MSKLIDLDSKQSIKDFDQPHQTSINIYLIWDARQIWSSKKYVYLRLL